jgi:hypothetical protein
MLKKKMPLFYLGAFYLIANFTSVTIFCDDFSLEIKMVKDEIKKDEIMVEGKIEKRNNDYYIKTINEDIKLPTLNIIKNKIQLDDFVDKSVILTAKGSIVNHDKLGVETVDKYIIVEIIKIQVVLKEEGKK